MLIMAKMRAAFARSLLANSISSAPSFRASKLCDSKDAGYVDATVIIDGQTLAHKGSGCDIR